MARGLTTKAQDKDKWSKLYGFAQRYAAPDALVRVFCLHKRESLTQEVSRFHKYENEAFQPPGCSHEGSNGIKLPAWIQTLIPTRELNKDYAIGWY